jgi:hypothetical protein
MDKKIAVEKAGGVGKLAEVFGITVSAVSQWPEGPLPDSRRYELMVKRPEWFTTTAHPEQQATEQAESLALARAHGALANTAA